MADLVWTNPAQQDFSDITDYLANQDPYAARRVGDRLMEAAQTLRRFSHQGRPGKKGGTRELVIAGLPYLVVYRAAGEKVEILRVLHGAQHWPEDR